VALWEMASELNLDPSTISKDRTVVGEIPYESERGYAARFMRDRGGVHVALKGAPELVLARCDRMAGEAEPLPPDRARIDRELATLSGSGHRVIRMGNQPWPNANAQG
jgi:magnesium-transporting ATPase (P-type)